ncbi:hypothetical protein Tco_0283178 [Tanacetum coccineum]
MEFEDISSKAMLAIDGVGFDWSDMAEEQVQTNIALMAFSDSKVYNDKTCSKTCLKNYETLKKQCDDLIVKLNQTEFTAATYKRGLATVEEQLITYKNNEVLFSKEVAVLKREKFDKASKDLDKLLESQITNKSKKGLEYSVIPPPHTLIYNRPKKLDLSYSGLDEFKEPKFKGYGYEDSKKESNVVCDKKSYDSKENSDNTLVKEQVSKDTSSFVESSLNFDKETVFPVDQKVESIKPKNHEKSVKKSVRVNYNYNYTTKRTHPNAQRNMVPRAVLMKTGLKPFNTARTVNTAHPKSTVFSAKPMSCFPKTVQSTVRRPFQSKTALSNKRFTHKVNTAKPLAVNTARPKTVKTVGPNSAIVNVVRVNQANGKLQQDDTGFVNSGCSRHMTGNIAYLSDFKELMGGDVTFGEGAHSGRISGKGLVCFPSAQGYHIKLGDWNAQTRFEATSKQSNDPPLSRGHTLRSGEDKIEVVAGNLELNAVKSLDALIDKKNVIITESSIRSDLHLEDAEYYFVIIPTDFSTTPITTQPSSSRSQKIQSMRKQRKDTAVTQEEAQQDDSVPTPSNDPPLNEKAKDAQAKEIADLKKRVQKLERKKKSRTTGFKRLRKVSMSRRVESSEDKDIDDTQGRSDDAEMFDTNELHGDEVVMDMPVGEKQEQSAKEKEVNTSVEDSAAPTTIEEITLGQTLIQIKAAKPKVVTTAAITITTSRPKARGVVLEAELIEEERLARKQEEEANIALIESWDNIKAMMEADFELAQRLQTEEQGEITIEERSRLFVELMNKRKKHFAMLRP